MSDHRVIDYEDATYRTDFWEGKGREYEDAVERIAIRRLMPLKGKRLLEAGAGFGRLTPMFDAYEQVVVLDYSAPQLEDARQRLGDEGKLYVAADLYRLPFAPGLFDGVTLIRVIHHIDAPDVVLANIRYVMQQGGTFLLEFANKQNLKAIARWLLHRQDWNPFTPEPVEFVELNYDFHPKYMRHKLSAASFDPGRTLTVSHYRLALLKRIIPTSILVTMDSLAQLSGNLVQIAPSVFVRNQAIGPDQQAPEGSFWRCPDCQSLDMDEQPDRVVCRSCGLIWPIVNGVYNFKEPLPT